MTILVLSHHEESSIALCAALERRKLSVRWSKTSKLSDSGVSPLVAVLDSDSEDLEELLSKLRETPWCRCYIMDPKAPPRREDKVFALYRPFDASLVAELLHRDCELADLERQRLRHAADALALGQLLQHSFEGFIGLDGEQRIVYFSPGAQDMYGYLPREVLGRPMSILDDPSGVPVPSAPSSDATSRSVFECTRRHANGHLLRILVARSPVRTNSALEPGYACVEVSLDVTQARDMEKQLAQQAKLAHLGRIAATMSHEINNPLAVIQSCGFWLQQYSSTCDTPELTEVASDLMIAVERISSFVKQITGFVRESPVNITSTPLSQTLELAFRMVRARAINKNVSIKFGDTLAANEAVGHDPSRLSHAIINILANAVDAAADGGKHVWVSAKHEQDGIILDVEDDGPGVAPEIADRLFEPFATTKAFGHGTGLGLPLTREVVLQHGGSISLLPRAAGGTLARLELPRSRTGSE